MILNDTYRTVEGYIEGDVFKDRGSKFIGYVFPVFNENQVKHHLEDLKSQHHKARHWCYAWRIGEEEEKMRYRINDDGEPSNSAGQPIYGQLLSFNITNVLVVVVRYYGGTKLGIGGLINAYKTATKYALDNTKIIEKTIDVIFKLTFNYEHMDKVMRIIKERKLTIISQQMNLNCVFTISVWKKKSEATKEILENLRCVIIK